MIVRALKTGHHTALLIFTILVGGSLIGWYFEEDRPSLGITDLQPRTCNRPAPANVWDFYDGTWNINRDLVANEFSLHAAVAHDVYKDCRDEADCSNHVFYQLNTLGAPWRLTKVSPPGAPNGFRAFVYENEEPLTLNVMVVFRGTDGLNLADYLYGNMSWFTQWFLPEDQYTSARRFMAGVVANATRQAAERKRRVCFTAVGHSLGGGLAQHVAYGFPNTSAVVIDSSFVLNLFRFKEPYYDARVVHIEERGDLLASLYEWLVGRLTPDNIYYPMNLVELECGKSKDIRAMLHERQFRQLKCRLAYLVYRNHSTFAVSEGMPRMVMDCRIHNPGCEVGVKRPISSTTLELGCRARQDKPGPLDLCGPYEHKFGRI